RSGWYLPALRLSARQLAAGGPGGNSLPRRLGGAVGRAGRFNAGRDILAEPQLSRTDPTRSEPDAWHAACRLSGLPRAMADGRPAALSGIPDDDDERDLLRPGGDPDHPHLQRSILRHRQL